MVRLINNPYGKDRMAVLPFDSISLTARLGGNTAHFMQWSGDGGRQGGRGVGSGGSDSLMHFECAALNMEID